MLKNPMNLRIQSSILQNAQYSQMNLDGNALTVIIVNQFVFENVKIRKISKLEDVFVAEIFVLGKIKEPIWILVDDNFSF